MVYRFIRRSEMNIHRNHGQNNAHRGYHGAAGHKYHCNKCV